MVDCQTIVLTLLSYVESDFRRLVPVYINPPSLVERVNPHHSSHFLHDGERATIGDAGLDVDRPIVLTLSYMMPSAARNPPLPPPPPPSSTRGDAADGIRTNDGRRGVSRDTGVLVPLALWGCSGRESTVFA